MLIQFVRALLFNYTWSYKNYQFKINTKYKSNVNVNFNLQKI